MPNAENQKILLRGARAWNAWRRDQPGSKGPDLSYADLRGLSLRGVNLSEVRLMGADLEDVDLTGASCHAADLSEANLRRADLSEVNFSQALLRGADLSGANLSASVLAGASLVEASLRGAALNRTVFADTDLRRASLVDVVFHGACALDPTTVIRSGALPESFLRGCGWPERLIEYWPSIAGQAIEFYSGFISYTHSDASFALRLTDRLQRRGVRVWRDEQNLRPGDHLTYEIDRGIRVFHKVLLCCSAASLSSPWVEREINMAIEKERRLTAAGESGAVLIPLDLDGYLFAKWDHPYKHLLTERLVADFRGWESDSAQFDVQVERVVRAMQVRGMKRIPQEPRLKEDRVSLAKSLVQYLQAISKNDREALEELARLVSPRLLDVSRSILKEELSISPEEPVEATLLDLWRRRSDLPELFRDSGGSEAFIAILERWTRERAQLLRRQARSRATLVGSPADAAG